MSMKLLFENWRRHLAEAAGEQKSKRTLYHISSRPAEPKPCRHRGVWVRRAGQKVCSGLFMTANPIGIALNHGIRGNVYAYKVPEWLIDKSGGMNRYDYGSEILISEDDWYEARNEIEFLGKSMNDQELRKKVQSMDRWDTQRDRARRPPKTGEPRKPGWVTDKEWKALLASKIKSKYFALRDTAHLEDAIKLMTPQEREEALEVFEKEGQHPEWYTSKPQPGERKGDKFPGYLKAGWPQSKTDKRVIALLKKYTSRSGMDVKIFENWRQYLKESTIDPEIINKIEDYIKLPIRAMYLYGSSAYSQQDREEFYGQEHEPGDKDIWVQLDIEYDPDLMDEIHDNWENSLEFEELQHMGYDVRLASKDEAVDEPNILLTKDLL